MEPAEIDFSELSHTLAKESEEADAAIRQGLQDPAIDSEAALDNLFDTVDELLCTDQYAAVDQLLRETDVANVSLQLLLTLLILTTPAQGRLQAFDDFKERAVSHIFKTQPHRRALRLLHGLV